MFRGSSALLALAATALACERAPSDPFVGQVTRSRWFEYHDHAIEALCPTLLSRLDEHADAIGGQLGLRSEGGFRFRYFKFIDGADMASSHGACDMDLGCSFGDTNYSIFYFHAHELAHDYVHRAWGSQSVRLLNEGEAVALSCEPDAELDANTTAFDVHAPADWRSLLYALDVEGMGYSAAGFFVTYLVRNYGWMRLAALHQRIPSDISVPDFESAFAAVYPLSVDQAWAEALGTRAAPACFKDWTCRGTAMAIGDSAAPDCDGYFHRSVTVDDGSAGVVLVPSGGVLALTDCGATRSPQYVLGTGGVQWVPLPPGHYALAPAQPEFPPWQVTFQSTFASSLVGAECGAAPPVALDPQNSTSIDVPPGSVEGWIRIDGTGSAYNVFSYNFSNLSSADGSPSGALSICPSCDPAVTCAPLNASTSLHGARVDIARGAAIRFSGAVATSSATLSWGQLRFEPQDGSLPALDAGQ